LPPDLRDWVPADHLVHFVIDAVELIDDRAAPVNARGTGSEQYPPGMLLALPVYSYATGTFSSARLSARVTKTLRCACSARTRTPITTRSARFAAKTVRC
jgi:transposase